MQYHSFCRGLDFRFKHFMWNSFSHQSQIITGWATDDATVASVQISHLYWCLEKVEVEMEGGWDCGWGETLLGFSSEFVSLSESSWRCQLLSFSGASVLQLRLRFDRRAIKVGCCFIWIASMRRRSFALRVTQLQASSPTTTSQFWILTLPLPLPSPLPSPLPLSASLPLSFFSSISTA